jgi:pimeloyl-ACP methyl ester carboxylesterase
MRTIGPLETPRLPQGVRARFVPGVNGLDMHVLEAGFETPGRPCLLLLHGFPELAFSWRKLIRPLAAAGFHVVAPDQRGYGRTTGWDADYDGDLRAFHLLNVVRDALALVGALGYSEVAAVIGHDFGSPVAAWCALIRPDVFRAVALMSAPFAGVAPLRAPAVESAEAAPDVHAELAALPRPRKHYQWYYSTRAANADMHRAPQGVHDFLRAYFHVKSADWPENKPFPLAGWTAQELAKMPTYYIMDLHKTMAETVAPEMPSATQIAGCRWLPNEDLRVYSAEYERTGFQGGLQWYRCATDSGYMSEFKLFAGRRIDVPACFIAGASDWGIYQKPRDLERMQERVCSQFRGCHLIEGAGHWVQQEQPERVIALLREFLGR